MRPVPNAVDREQPQARAVITGPPDRDGDGSITEEVSQLGSSFLEPSSHVVHRKTP